MGIRTAVNCISVNHYFNKHVNGIVQAITFIERIFFTYHLLIVTGQKVKGRFLLFQVYRNFANLFIKLSVSTFYKQISKFQ